MRLPQSQRGVSIVIAIFIILILSMLGASMVRVLSQGDELVARDVLSTRALFAAESGAERMLNEIFLGGGCGPLNWNNIGGGPSPCQANVTCAAATVNSVTVYDIESRGECGSGDVIAHRIVRVQAADPP